MKTKVLVVMAVLLLFSSYAISQSSNALYTAAGVEATSREVFKATFQVTDAQTVLVLKALGYHQSLVDSAGIRRPATEGELTGELRSIIQAWVRNYERAQAVKDLQTTTF